MSDNWNETRPLADRVADRARDTGDAAANSADRVADRTRQIGNAAADSVENAADKARDLGNRASDAVQSATDQAKDLASNARDKAADLADTARDKASELADTASDKADSAMTATGTQMQSLAQTVREKAPEGTVGEYANQAADALDKGGRYLQDADLDTVRSDLETIIRQHPIESLLVGLGVGFLLARATRR